MSPDRRYLVRYQDPDLGVRTMRAPGTFVAPGPVLSILDTATGLFVGPARQAVAS